MASIEFAPRQHETEQITAHVIWMTSGLSCDGDSVAMTSAVDPSLEDIITGAIPGMPKVVAHTPVLAYEVGAEFMQAWYDAEAGKLDPFVLIVEGSIPNEKINGEGHLVRYGRQPVQRSADHHERVDRSPRAEVRRNGCPGHLRDVRRHPGDEEQPDGRDGPVRLPRLGLDLGRGHSRRQHPRLPRAAGQHDRVADGSRHGAGRHRADPGARRAAPPGDAFRPHRA